MGSAPAWRGGYRRWSQPISACLGSNGCLRPRPALAAVAIFTFVASWNNFIWPFIAITNTNMMTIPVGLANVQSAYGICYAQIMASAVLGGIPLLIVFMFFQKQIVQGISGTGLKG